MSSNNEPKPMNKQINSSDWPWKLGTLPFLYSPLSVPTNGPSLPDSLPFALDIDQATGTMTQVRNKAVSCVLAKAYLKGSELSGTMNEHGIGREYAEDFLSFLTSVIPASRLDGARVLEIGCGTGYYLYRLKNLGADVVGVEPGPHGQDGTKRFQVPIVRDFFPSQEISGEFDLIVLYGVLEHMEQPSAFLVNVQTHLSERGRIVLSVPDCEPFMMIGDLSILLHEHWNYYTSGSLRKLLESVGLDLEVRKSSFCGALYGIGKDTSARQLDDASFPQESRKVAIYRRAANIALKRFLNYLREAIEKGESVGIYVPGRAINALWMVRQEVDLSTLRFFDDNSVLHGTYFPGFDIPIEPRPKLIEDPTDKILIMSRAFGERIANQLSASLDGRVMITMWQDLLLR